MPRLQPSKNESSPCARPHAKKCKRPMSERNSAVPSATPFTERLARVRHRFVASLESKIDSVYAALPKLSGEGTAVAEVVDENYRRIHDIVGVSPSVGFFATGRVARTVENILSPPAAPARTQVRRNRLTQECSARVARGVASGTPINIFRTTVIMSKSQIPPAPT